MAISFSSGALRRSEYNIRRATAASAYENAMRERAKLSEDEKNRGGLFGGLGYLGEKFGLGFLQSVEGIADFTVGGLAKLFGADDWAEEIMSSDWVDYTHADDWFNPDSAWSVAGDVAGGIGTSVPAIATAVGITLASGGTAAPLAVGLASGGVAGLGAAGTATKEAYQKTGQLTGKEFGYGALSGLTEAGIEALSNVVGFGSGTVIKSITNGVGKGTLKGAAKSAAKSVVKSATKEAAESAAKSAAKTAAKTVAKKTLGKELLSGFVGEAFEEGLAEFLSPFWARATYDPDAQMATLDEVAYASFVGGLSGMIMSGGNVAVDSGVSFFKGNSINGKGQASEVMGLSDVISKYEAENATGDEDISRVSETYTKLSESLKNTGGVVQTVAQKKMLGDLQRENTAAIFKPAMVASAANAVANADALQVKLAEMGITNADGTAITADQIRAGVDVNDRKSFSKALKENSALRTVAAMDVAGRLMTDSKRLTDASLRGEALASRVDLANFATTASPAEKQVVSEALGIDDWTSLDAASFNKKVVEFVENGGVERYKQLRELIKNADTLPEADARPMPKFMNMQKDGIRRYSDENSRIAVMKNGDTYRLYDYDSRTVSKELTRTEVNAALREYNTKKNAVTSMNQQNMQVTENVDGSVATDTNVGGNDITNVTSAETVEKSATELDSIAKENIPEYSKLSVPSRVMIRKVLYDALAAGYSESDAILFARVSARSGLHMTFSKSLCLAGRIKGTKDLVYGDGYYDPYDNRIVINPEGTRSVDALLIHELTHAVYKDKRGRIILERGAKNMSDEQKQSIIKSYSKVAKGSSAVIMDEMNAHYIEGQLKNKNLLEALLSDEPTLKDKILSFFKGASTDYAGNAELSGAAKRLYRRYKKLFDSFSAKNQGTNAYGAPVMNSAVHDDGKRWAIADFLDGTTQKDITEYVNNAYENKNADDYKPYAKADERLIKDVADQIDVSEYTHALRDNDIRHIRNSHGENTNEKYPVTKEDLSLIPAIVTNYDKVFVKTNSRGKPGLIYVKVGLDNVTYYVEAVTEEYHNEKLLVNKQMIKTGIDEIPNLYGFKDAINKKESSSQYLADLKQIREAYVQDVKENYSTKSIPQKSDLSTDISEKNSSKRFALPEIDSEYFSAVERGDMETAQKMVDEAAKKAGYSDKLYHGTKQFGFTEFDPSHSDDKISIFVAGSEDLAQTYSGRYGKKQISDVADVDALSIDKVVERLSQESRDSYEGAELQTEYEVMNSDDIKNLFSSVDGDIERLQDIVEAKIKVYADKLATDFNDSDYKIHKRLVELNRMLEYYLYDEISTPLYMLINHTDVFADNSGVSDIEYKIRLRNKLSRANATDGVVIKKDLDGYGVSVMSFESARQELKNMLAEGNYALYGNPKNQLVIDGKGQNWNDIRHWSNAVHYTKEGTVAERKGEFFRLYDKKTGNEIFHGRLAVNTYSEGLSADMRHLVMINKANNVIDVRSEYMHTTREIARFAKESGYDSVKFENITDNGGLGESTGSGDVYAYFDPNNLKSADPVTYDDNGNVIPLSERFNPENKDIRFALPEGDAALEELLAERDTLESVENSFDAKAIVSKGLPLPTGRENISRGELKKIIANNTADKVYSRSDAMRVVGRFMGVSDLTQKAQAEITDGVWQLLNDSSSYEVRAENARAMSEFIVAKMINDVLVDNESSAYYEAAERMAFLRSGIGMLSFSKSDISEIKYVLDTKGLKKILGRWQKKKARFTYPMDVFVTDIAREMPGMEYLEEMHPAEAMLEIDSIYSNLRNTLAEKKIPFYLDVTDSEIQYMIDGIESVIMQAYETEGSESKFSRYVDSRIGYYREYAEFYKAKYDQIKGYDRLCGLVASKAQRMKDLKLGTFRNATQAETDTFKKTIMSLSRVNYRGNMNQGGTRKILGELKDWYIPTNPVLMVPDPENLSENTGLYVPGIAEKLSALSSGKTKQFTKEELRDLYDVLSYFVKFVEDYGKVYYRGQMVEALPIAKNFIKIAEENRALKGTAFAVLRKKLSVYADTFFDPASLVRMKDLYNPDGFYTSMFDMLREATMNSDIAEMDVLAPLEAFLESNKKYIESASKDIVDYMGHSIPKIQLIDLYMSMGRRQAHRGIAESGFKFKNLDGETETVRGFLENGTEMSDEEIAKAINRKRAEIFKSFSAADLEYIKILDRVYNEDVKRLKVQRDFERYGFTNAVEDYYYPIRRFAGNTNIDTDAKAELDRVSSASFNEDTVKGAKQMLIIESADSRMRRHVRAVCDYAYLSPAISSFNVLYNLDIGGNPNAPINVKSVTENSWSAGESYIRKLVADIQGIPQGSKEGQVLLGKIRGGYAKFQLGANPKVWFTQGSSLFASSSILDADSITYGASHYGQQTVSDVFKYCRLAELRASDNTAALAQAVLDKDGRALSKVGNIGKGINKVSDALMTPIGKVDEFIIRRLYAACQHQVAKNNGPAIGTVENKKAAGELLTKVILETQQNTMATERSAAMRSNNEVLRTLTMFTSDAMKVVGRVIDGFGELMAVRARIKATTDQKTLAALNAQKKAAGKKLGKAVAALSTSAIYMAALGQLFFWLYGKERDEDEKWWEVFAADSVGNLFGGLPIFSDVYSFFVDGYEIESFTYSSINDLLTSTKQVFDTVGKITSGEATSQDVAKNTRNIIYSIGQMTGLPFRNVYNVFYGATKHLSPEAAFNIDNAFYAKNYKTELSRALEKGDDRMVAHIMSLILGESVGNADDVVLSELVAISKAGEKVLPHEIPDKITVNDVEYVISPEQQAGMMQVSSLADNDLKKLFVRSSYKGLSYANKALAVDYIYDLYYDKAIEDVLGIDRKNSALAFIDVIGADVFALLYILTKGLESDKDKDGNTVAGSKRKKVIAAINSLGISTEQKLLLIAAKGYSIADGDIKGVSAANARRRLLKYILSSKISAAKKTEIASLCGFTVKNGKILNDL